MNPVIKIAAMVVGGAGLFLGSLVGFSRMNGVPWHKVPLVGSAFPPPPEIEQPPQEPSVAPAPTPVVPPKLEAQTAGLGVLDVFRLDAPWNATQIEELVTDLKASKLELDKRLADIEKREAKLDARATLLDEQYAVVKGLRAELDRWKGELELQAAELENAKRQKNARDQAGWEQVAKLFEKGDATELGARLKTYEAQDAAKILAKLKPARAQEILNTLSGEEWKDFAEAYRLSVK